MILCVGPASAAAAAAGGFGPLSGPGGCLVAPGRGTDETRACGPGKALVGPNAVAGSPDGANGYVAPGGHTSSATQSAFGSVAILKRNPETGALTETGCLSSDGTDGRDGASGACTASPSLLGADGVAVSADGLTVFVTSGLSGSVVAFARESSTGSLTRLGCYQQGPPPGSPCPPARVFFSASALVASADGQALYIAGAAQRALSRAPASLVTQPASSASTAPAPGSVGMVPMPSVAAIFGLSPTPSLSNPCIAANG